MQIFTLKLGESLRIGDDVRFTLLDTKGRAVKTGTDAPKHVNVYRKEIAKKPVTCPRCAGELRVELRFAFAGSATLAGMTPKLSAEKVPHMVCATCGFVEQGRK